MIPTAFSPRFLLPILALLALALAGCGSRLSAAHLGMSPLAGAGPGQAQGKFLRFVFETVKHDAAWRVRGQALPVGENLPAWADAVADLTVLAYLCDAEGDVLAHQSRRYPAQKAPAGGFPFDFTLSPAPSRPGPLFLSFGYSAVFVPSASPGGDRSFFAGEKAALTR